MEEPPFDDDDLIHDDNYNEEEFPEEYCEYEPEDFEHSNDEHSKRTNQHQSHLQETLSENQNHERLNDQTSLKDVQMLEEHQDEIPVSVTVSRSEALERDLYSFERYVVVGGVSSFCEQMKM